MKTVNYWDPDLGIFQVVITTQNGTHLVGAAKCSPEDQDMLNEKTGGYIAEKRAFIKYLQYQRDNELKPELKALKKFLYTINKSKYFKEEDYSNQMLLRAIKRAENDIKEINDLIQSERLDLQDYIKSKGEFYKMVRKRRKKLAEATESNKAKN